MLYNLLRWSLYLALAFLAWKIVPVYASTLRFNFALSEACRFGATGGTPLTDIRDDIFFKAGQLHLPIRRQDIEVQVRHRTVVASVHYQVPIGVGRRQVVLKFHANASEAPLLIREGGEESFGKLGE